jgi:hypothetical protein
VAFFLWQGVWAAAAGTQRPYGGGTLVDGTSMDPLWRLIETYHAVVYYAPERVPVYGGLGLKGGWMGYFASRSAALGCTPPEVVAACFYNFDPAMVSRSLPDAWKYTTPQAAVHARQRVFDAAARRLLGAVIDGDCIAEAAELATTAVNAGRPQGRPLFAAHAALDRPEAPHAALFWATGALREFRGEGHNAALLRTGVDGCSAHVLMAGLGLVPADQRSYRGWSDAAWSAAQDRLQRRGWLKQSGVLTAAGKTARAAIEQETNDLAQEPFTAMGPDGERRLRALLAPVVERIVTEGGIPYPNGMGVPPVPELTSST